MGEKATIRALLAAQRREEREAQRRLRELERQAKEQAKLSAIEQARLEVERFENQLEVLLSVHKERGNVRIGQELQLRCPHHVRKTIHVMNRGQSRARP